MSTEKPPSDEAYEAILKIADDIFMNDQTGKAWPSGSVDKYARIIDAEFCARQSMEAAMASQLRAALEHIEYLVEVTPSHWMQEGTADIVYDLRVALRAYNTNKSKP